MHTILQFILYNDPLLANIGRTETANFDTSMMNDNNGDADGNPQFDDDDDGNAAVLYVLYSNLFLKTRFCRLISVLLHTIDGNDSVYAVNNNADNGRLNIQLLFLVTDLPTALTNNNKMNINDDNTNQNGVPIVVAGGTTIESMSYHNETIGAM